MPNLSTANAGWSSSMASTRVTAVATLRSSTVPSSVLLLLLPPARKTRLDGPRQYLSRALLGVARRGDEHTLRVVLAAMERTRGMERRFTMHQGFPALHKCSAARSPTTL